MPIRLRLALAFAVAAAAIFALGGWLFIGGLSSAQLGAIDSQLGVQLSQAGRYLTAGSQAGSRAAVPVSTWCRSSTPRAGCAARARTPGPSRCWPRRS